MTHSLVIVEYYGVLSAMWWHWTNNQEVKAHPLVNSDRWAFSVKNDNLADLEKLLSDERRVYKVVKESAG